MKALKKIRKKEHGSFTLEATILFPILLIIVLLFVFFSLIIYEKVTLQYRANKIVSEMAHSWGSSSMDLETNELETIEDYVTENGDGLYWRLTSNNALQEIFGWGGGNSSVVDEKLNRAGEYSDDITFDYGFFTQKVKISLKKELALPDVLTSLFGISNVGASASKPVIDPVENIRNTDFMLYGFGKITESVSQYFDFFN